MAVSSVEEKAIQLSYFDEHSVMSLETGVDPVGGDIFVADTPKLVEHELTPVEQAWIEAKGQQGLDLLDRIGAEGMLVKIRDSNLGGRGVIEGRIEVVYPVRNNIDKARKPFDVITTMSLQYRGGFYEDGTEKFGRVAIGVVDNGNWGIAYTTSPNEGHDTQKDASMIHKQLLSRPIAQLDPAIRVYYGPQHRVANLPVIIDGELTPEKGPIKSLGALTQLALDTQFAPQPGEYAA